MKNTILDAKIKAIKEAAKIKESGRKLLTSKEIDILNFADAILRESIGTSEYNKL